MLVDFLLGVIWDEDKRSDLIRVSSLNWENSFLIICTDVGEELREARFKREAEDQTKKFSPRGGPRLAFCYP